MRDNSSLSMTSKIFSGWSSDSYSSVRNCTLTGKIIIIFSEQWTPKQIDSVSAMFWNFPKVRFACQNSQKLKGRSGTAGNANYPKCLIWNSRSCSFCFFFCGLFYISDEKYIIFDHFYMYYFSCDISCRGGMKNRCTPSLLYAVYE